MRFLRPLILLLVALGLPAAAIYFLRRFGIINPHGFLDWLKVAAAYATWLGLFFAFFQALPNMRKKKPRPERPPPPTDAAFPFKVLRPVELYDSLTTIPHAHIPYTARSPEAELRSLLSDMRAATKLIITGRAGLGKTREAIEHIRRLEAELGEEVTVLIPTSTLEVPTSIDKSRLGRNVVLFIDDLPAFAAIPHRSMDPDDPKLQDSFRQRFDETIRAFSNIYGRNFRVVATAKVEPQQREPINWSDPFWKSFKVLPLPDLSPSRRYEFLQTSEQFFGLRITVDAKLLLSKKSDGTFGGLIFPLVQEKSKSPSEPLNEADVSKYRCTYPNDWEEQIYLRYFAKDKYRKSLITALAIVREGGIEPYAFLIIDLAARLCSPRLPLLRRWRIRRELKRVSDWIRRKGERLECEDAYLRDKGGLQNPEYRDRLLACLPRALRRHKHLAGLESSLYRLIDTLLDQHDLPSAALVVCEHLIDAGVEDGRVWLSVSKVHQQLHDYDQAEQAARKAVNSNQRVAGLARLGSIYAARNKLNESITAFREAVNTRPLSASLVAHLGVVLSKNGDHDAAIEAGKKAIELDPFEPIHHARLGISFDKAGRYEEAINAFQAALRLDDLNAPTWWSLSIAYSKDEQFENAINAGEKAVELAPESSTAWSNLGQVFSRAGQSDVSIPMFEKALEYEPENVEILTGLAVSYELTSQFDRAIKTLEQARALDPTNVQILVTLGFSFRKSERYEEALQTMRDAAEAAPRNIQVLDLLGHILNDLKRYEEALDIYRRARSIAPGDLQILGSLSYTLNRLKRHEESLQILDRAREVQRDNVQVLASLAYTLGKLNRFDEALPLLRRAREIEPNSASVLRRLGYVLSVKEEFEEAVEVLLLASKIEPDSVKILVRLGVTLNRLERFKEALALLERGRDLQPDNVAVLAPLGYTLTKLERYEDAVEVLKHGREVDPDNTSLLGTLGFALDRLNRFDEATHVLQHAATIDPTNSQTWHVLSYRYTEQNEFEKAVQAMGALFKVDPNYSAAFLSAQILLWKLEAERVTLTTETAALLPLLQAAATKLQSSKSVSSSEQIDAAAEELWSAGESHFRAGRIDVAIKAFTEAVELNPDYLSRLEQLGLQLNFTNRFPESLQVAIKLSELKPDDPKYFYAVATAYRKLGDDMKAKEYYERTAQVAPASNYARRARGRLVN